MISKISERFSVLESAPQVNPPHTPAPAAPAPVPVQPASATATPTQEKIMQDYVLLQRKYIAALEAKNLPPYIEGRLGRPFLYFSPGLDATLLVARLYLNRLNCYCTSFP